MILIHGCSSPDGVPRSASRDRPRGSPRSGSRYRRRHLTARAGRPDRGARITQDRANQPAIRLAQHCSSATACHLGGSTSARKRPPRASRTPTAPANSARPSRPSRQRAPRSGSCPALAATSPASPTPRGREGSTPPDRSCSPFDRGSNRLPLQQVEFAQPRCNSSAFCCAICRAAGEISVAVTCKRSGAPMAIARAIAPEPVPTSRTRAGALARSGSRLQRSRFRPAVSVSGRGVRTSPRHHEAAATRTPCGPAAGPPAPARRHRRRTSSRKRGAPRAVTGFSNSR